MRHSCMGERGREREKDTERMNQNEREGKRWLTRIVEASGEW